MTKAQANTLKEFIDALAKAKIVLVKTGSDINHSDYQIYLADDEIEGLKELLQKKLDKYNKKGEVNK